MCADSTSRTRSRSTKSWCAQQTSSSWESRSLPWKSVCWAQRYQSSSWCSTQSGCCSWSTWRTRTKLTSSGPRCRKWWSWSAYTARSRSASLAPWTSRGRPWSSHRWMPFWRLPSGRRALSPVGHLSSRSTRDWRRTRSVSRLEYPHHCNTSRWSSRPWKGFGNGLSSDRPCSWWRYRWPRPCRGRRCRRHRLHPSCRRHLLGWPWGFARSSLMMICNRRACSWLDWIGGCILRLTH